MRQMTSVASGARLHTLSFLKRAVGLAGPLLKGNKELPSAMPVAPAVVVTAVIRMPVTPPIVVAVRVVSWTNSNDYAETVSVMLVFAISGLGCIGAYQGKSCADKDCSQSKFLEHKLTSCL